MVSGAYATIRQRCGAAGEGVGAGAGDLRAAAAVPARLRALLAWQS